MKILSNGMRVNDQKQRIVHWFQNHGREAGGSRSTKSKALQLHKRMPPTVEPYWRTFQRENYLRRVKPRVDEELAEEMRKYRAQLAKTPPGEMGQIKTPARISILNRVSQEMYNEYQNKQRDTCKDRTNNDKNNDGTGGGLSGIAE